MFSSSPFFNICGNFIDVAISHGKTIYKISLPPSSLVSDLKAQLQLQSGISSSLQKLLAKGSVLKDDQQVSSLGKTKIMMMASASTDIAKVAAGALCSIVAPPISSSMIDESWAEATVRT